MHRTSRLLSGLGILLLLMATGCFQTAGEGLQATSVAQSVATFTPPPLPTLTPTEELTSEVTSEPAVEFTEEATAEVFATETPQTIAQAATETPTPDTFGSVNDAGQAQVDDPALTATAIIASATARAEATNLALTQPVIQPSPTTGFEQPVFPTLTPTFDTGQGGGGFVTGVDCEHEIRRGDNLFRISLYYGLPIDQIAQRNGITNINLIIAGRKLVIPGCGTTGNPPPPTTVPGPGPGPGRTYVVQQGDNLFRISLRYGVPISAIAAANGIANINLIYIGQVLVIP